MNIVLEPGCYVVAVSGGVDSMVLLDVLMRMPRQEAYKFVVAHYDHGIRADSALDRQHVAKVAAEHGLHFEYMEGKLGIRASENEARQARYAFLRQVKATYRAAAIITAHHQDDVLETAIHNMLRGTNRRGLIALRSRQDILRPLLEYPKQEILEYARSHDIEWREDVTNQDLRYRRNYIRHEILPNFSELQRQKLVEIIAKLTLLDDQIEQETDAYLQNYSGDQGLNRAAFIGLPHAVSREVLAAWLRLHGVREVDTKLIERLVRAIKTFAAGKKADIDDGRVLEVHTQHVQIVARDR